MDLPYSLPHLDPHPHPLHHPPLLPLGCHLLGTAQSHCRRLAPSSPPVESPLVLVLWPGAKKVSNLELRLFTHAVYQKNSRILTSDMYFSLMLFQTVSNATVSTSSTPPKSPYTNQREYSHFHLFTSLRAVTIFETLAFNYNYTLTAVFLQGHYKRTTFNLSICFCE